jgi:selenocysteine-specific elongation factor
MNAPDTTDHPQPTLDTPFVIGTAGHVDHGKSTLVRALTGIDPDRLAEEREREMTIDIGFAWLTLPDGRAVSIIDVPGHERFVRNMLAGVGGIDLALLVIAADDGPMPQTREHLAILDLLGVQRAVVALSRIDLVDVEWRELVAEEIRELLADTSLAGSAIVPVSAVTGEGLDRLKAELAGALERLRPRDAAGRPRVPVDRSFKVAGFGTVVSGTLIGGEVHVGQELMLYPDRRPVRVRGLQSHQHQVDRALAGSRVALNLAGVNHDEVRRGHVLAPAGTLSPSMRIDGSLRLLDDAPVVVEQNQDVQVFIGSAEVGARVTLLDRERIGPGEEGWVQLRLAQPLSVLRGDRFILRRPSPATTIGGGVVVDPTPARHRRFQRELIASLDVLRKGTPGDLVLQQLGQRPAELGEIERAVGLDDLVDIVADLIASGELIAPGHAPGSPLARRTLLMRATAFERAAERARDLVDQHHRAHALEAGMRREDLRGALGIRSQRAFDEIVRELGTRNIVRADGAYVASPEFRIELLPEQRRQADAFIAAARDAAYTPPPPQAFDVSPALVQALEALGEVVAVADQIVYAADVFEALRDRVIAHLDANGTIALAEYRDLFGTSRKYAQPTLEYLDERRVTRRQGDVRVRYRGPGAAGRS